MKRPISMMFLSKKLYHRSNSRMQTFLKDRDDLFGSGRFVCSRWCSDFLTLVRMNLIKKICFKDYSYMRFFLGVDIFTNLRIGK